MKALSLRQPWAWLVANGYKDIENRVWRTSARGLTLIHASLGMTMDEYHDCLAFIRSRERIAHVADLVPAPGDLERGGIVGQCEISDCVSAHDSPWFMGPYGSTCGTSRCCPFANGAVN